MNASMDASSEPSSAGSRRARLPRRRAVTAAAALALAASAVFGVLTACVSPSTPSVPSGTAGESGVGAVWLDGGRILGVMTQGSSSCAPVAADPMVDAEGTLEVHLAAPANATACTRDLVWRTTLLTAPAQIDRADDLRIQVSGTASGETTLAGTAATEAAVDEYSASIGLSSIPGALVLLTWGSSGCPPVLDTVRSTGDELDIAFAPRSADRVCTADLVPRTLIVPVPDGGADAQTAVLSGDGFNDVHVTIPAAG
ncbi:hypothetical protein [uncultured Microbacterium sp.]|uniref:hypothetical protein n=1 Tax=uncultured Microbacterium sp. TaxID=191216 RepID=UPI0025D08B74|nr:hypothetical protein [uncultured Microbacterium sp.]